MTHIRRPVGRPKTITDMKAYKAEWARRDRAKKKAVKDAATPNPTPIPKRGTMNE